MFDCVWLIGHLVPDRFRSTFSVELTRVGLRLSQLLHLFIGIRPLSAESVENNKMSVTCTQPPYL